METGNPDVTRTVRKPKPIKKKWLKRRTVLEKVLFVALVVVLICLLGLAIALAIKDKQAADGPCVSPECLKSANEVLMWTDSKRDPCEDFYNYTCTKWINDAEQSEGSTTRFSSLKNELDHRLKALLESDHTVPYHFQRARLYYKTCMDTEKRETSESVDQFLYDLESFGGYPALSPYQWEVDKFNYLTVLRHMHGKGTVAGLFITVDAELDLKNNSRQLITLSQTTLGLPNKDYFAKNQVVREYINMLTRQAFFLCQYNPEGCPRSTQEEIHEELTDAVEVERHLAKLSVSSDDLTSKENVYNVMEIADLQDEAPGINWWAYIQIFFPEVSDTEEIVVHTPNFMVEFSEYISNLVSTKEGKRKLANYLMYRHTLGASSHLTNDLINVYNEFRRMTFHQDDPPKHWVDCVTKTREIFDLSLASMYAQKYFPAEKKAALEDMVNTIRGDMKEILKETSWMDHQTREAALLKIENMHTVAGYPDGLLDTTELNRWYGELEIGEDHYKNYKWTSVFLHGQPWDSYKRPVDRKSWRYLPGDLLQTNAFFNNQNNTMFIPLGIAQDWFFNENSPKFLNYARMGFVVAREMAHAFDSHGAEFDEQGNWRMWWTNTTEKNFKKNSKCMVDMFNNYFVPEAKRKINGTQTLTENMADNLGVAAVYMAYTTASTKEPDRHLPGISLSPHQLFWVNMASMWCEKHPNEVYEEMVKNDHHPPSRYRIKSSLSNSNDFAQDFECKVGSAMNKDSKCHVWR